MVEALVKEMITIPDVKVTGEAEVVVCDATAGCGEGNLITHMERH
jgi:hypothetical protein